MNLPQTSNSTPNSNSRWGTQTVSTSGDGLPTRLAFPDSDNSSLDGVLSTEGTTVSAVLGDFDLTEKLTEGGTVSGSVLSGDSNLFGAMLTHIEFRI